MLDHFEMFAAYNSWANLRLYEAATELTDTDYHRNCKVAFGSLHGTLNHILVGDALWMARFQQLPPPPYALDTILARSLKELGTARAEMDAAIIKFIDTLDEDQISGTFTYTPVTVPEPVCQQLGQALSHFFNHQTHHRGQAHAILTRLAGEAPPLDLIYYQREAGLVQIG